MHCILQTEDERDNDITEEMVVCSLLGGDLGSSNNPAGATLGAVGILEISKTWPPQPVYGESVIPKTVDHCVLHDQTQHLNYNKLPQTHNRWRCCHLLRGIKDTRIQDGNNHHWSNIQSPKNVLFSKPAGCVFYACFYQLYQWTVAPNLEVQRQNVTEGTKFKTWNSIKSVF